jgi:hypothetical protein
VPRRRAGGQDLLSLQIHESDMRINPRSRCVSEFLESRVPLTTFTVTSTANAGPGTLRQAILDLNRSLPAAALLSS